MFETIFSRILANVLTLYPLKTTGNIWLSGSSREYKMEIFSSIIIIQSTEIKENIATKWMKLKKTSYSCNRLSFSMTKVIETSPLIWRPNQWTDFYMIETSVINELSAWKSLLKGVFRLHFYSLRLFAKIFPGYLTIFTKKLHCWFLKGSWIHHG